MRFVLIAALLASLALASCTSAKDTIEDIPTASSSSDGNPSPVAAQTTRPAAQQGTVSLVDKGFYVSQSGSNTYAYYAFTVKNTDTSRLFESNQYQVSFFDAANNPVGSDSGSITVVLPGETAAAANQARLTGTPARIEVAISAGRASSAAANLRPFAPIDATYQPDRFLGGNVIGTLQNPYAADLKDLRATAVLYNAQGGIIGGWFTFLNLLPASGTIAADVDFLATPPETPARTVIYVGFSNLTLLDLQQRQP